MLKKILGACLSVLAGLCLIACSVQKEASQVQSGMRIVTSFYPIYSLVKEVSGDKNDVRMIGSRSGIHSYEPSAADIRAIYDADVFIYHSRILESWAGRLDPNLQGSSVQVLEASTTLPLSKVPGLEDMEVGQGIDEASLYDPHTWLDPVLVGQEALEIGELLAESDPENADYYRENARALERDAQKLADKYIPIFAKSSSKTFVTQHTAFSYTAQRFGLKNWQIVHSYEEIEAAKAAGKFTTKDGYIFDPQDVVDPKTKVSQTAFRIPRPDGSGFYRVEKAALHPQTELAPAEALLAATQLAPVQPAKPVEVATKPSSSSIIATPAQRFTPEETTEASNTSIITTPAQRFTPEETTEASSTSKITTPAQLGTPVGTTEEPSTEASSQSQEYKIETTPISDVPVDSTSATNPNGEEMVGEQVSPVEPIPASIDATEGKSETVLDPGSE